MTDHLQDGIVLKTKNVNSPDSNSSGIDLDETPPKRKRKRKQFRHQIVNNTIYDGKSETI